MIDPLDERRRQVVDWHAHHAPLYRAFVDHLQNFVTQALEDSAVDVHSVDGRVKTVDSLVAKSLRPGVAGGFKYGRGVLRPAQRLRARPKAKVPGRRRKQQRPTAPGPTRPDWRADR